MTAIAFVGDKRPHQLLETIAISNQTAASTAVSKAFGVPAWARYATVILDITLGGTTPTFAFVIKGADVAALGYPDDGHLFSLGAAWDGVTTRTTNGTHSIGTIVIGPDIATDDTGSATADDNYGILAPLPPVMVYTYTSTDSNDDADYTGTITVYYSGA